MEGRHRRSRCYDSNFAGRLVRLYRVPRGRKRYTDVDTAAGLGVADWHYCEQGELEICGFCGGGSVRRADNGIRQLRASCSASL